MSAPGRNLILLSLTVLMSLFLGVAPALAQGQVHTVQPGDTLSSIALRYGTTPQAIAQANGLGNVNYIYAGQRLTIPSNSSAVSSEGTYTVRPGDTLSSIAASRGTTVASLAQANGLLSANYIYVGQRLIISGSGSSSSGSTGQANAGNSVHTVQRGETLASIAYRYGTTVAAIVAANSLSNPNYIYPGQQLRIPAAGSVAGPTGPASGGGQRIVVDLSDQRMFVYQDGQLLWNWVVSTGRPGQETVVGHFKVLNKIPNAYAYTWSLQMPYWLGIYWAGSLQNGIHALPIQANGQRLWDGYLGQRVSFGCIILSTDNAATLYNWASVGTPVDIVW
jgi:LysM repeat protein